MKLSELKKYVDRYLEYERDDPEVVIQIKLPYSTGFAIYTRQLWNSGSRLLNSGSQSYRML